MAKSDLDRFIQSASFVPERTFIPSSLPSINLAIDNIKGFQVGRLLELVGMYSTGKTTLGNDLIKNAQLQGLRTLFVDIECTFDLDYAITCGVNPSMLDVMHADTAENTLTLTEQNVSNYGIIVLDSLPALLPKEELEKTYDENAKMAAVAGLLTRFYKRIVPLAYANNCLVVLLNQYRANFSPMARTDRKPYGPYSASHAITWRLELAREKNEDGIATIAVKVTKNKLGSERGLAKYGLLAGGGLDIAGDVLTLAAQHDIVEKSGAWYYYPSKSNPQYKAQGLDNARKLLPINEIKEKVVTHVSTME
jgi:recombination protein RecA